MAAINKNEDIRLKSSSGGIFYLLAERIIQEGGVVFGARFDADWQVVIDYTETLQGVEAFMGSKYVQARIDHAYQDAKRFLQQGRKVLFSGTPCQIAGLHQYLRKPYEQLFTVDFICHGTPSPKAWAVFLQETVQSLKDVQAVRFRDKTCGWKKFGFALSYDQSHETISLLAPFYENPYMKAFLKNISLRPSCHACKANAGRSFSDLTLADFWGVETIFPHLDDDKGTGLVLVQSEKGDRLLEHPQLHSLQTSYELIKPLNPCCYQSVASHPKRDFFFQNLEKKSFTTLVATCTRPSIRQRLGECKANLYALIKNPLQLYKGG